MKEHGNSDAKYTLYKDGEMIASRSLIAQLVSNQLIIILAWLNVVQIWKFKRQFRLFRCCKRQSVQSISRIYRGGRVVRWCWVNFQCRGVLQFGLQ